MKMLRRSRWLARLAGCTALATGAAGMASAPSQDAQARVTGIVFHSDVAASWGLNLEGELGDGTTADRSGYGDIKVGNNVVQVAAGYFHALAVRSDGTVWAWGDNADGQLGDGTRTNRSTPAQVTGLTGVFTQVAAGTEYTVILGTDGSVWGMGYNGLGQLNIPLQTTPVTRPVNGIAASSGITQISAGYTHMLALKSNGTVLAWGSNQAGQLGNGTRDPVTGPVQVTGLTAATQVRPAGGGSAPRSTPCRTWWGRSGEIAPCP
jgi:alpha-tubulin suppressor-like RCC1 family protein